jgi:hypothetical protein
MSKGQFSDFGQTLIGLNTTLFYLFYQSIQTMALACFVKLIDCCIFQRLSKRESYCDIRDPVCLVYYKTQVLTISSKAIIRTCLRCFEWGLVA